MRIGEWLALLGMVVLLYVFGLWWCAFLIGPRSIADSLGDDSADADAAQRVVHGER